MYNKVYLIKATSKTLLPFTKTSEYKDCLNFEKTASDALAFHGAFQIGCIHISNCGLNRRTY